MISGKQNKLGSRYLQTPNRLIPLSSKYRPQLSILEHFQSVFFLLTREIKNYEVRQIDTKQKTKGQLQLWVWNFLRTRQDVRL